MFVYNVRMNIRKIVSVAACIALAALHSAADIRAVTPCQPDADWTKNWWMPRHNQKMEQVRKGGAPIVFLGDSITHNWESPGREQWNKYFAVGRYRALNLGFSGDRTEHVLWRLDNGELSGYEVKAVVLMIGTNNTGHFPYDKEPPLDTIIGVRAVLDKIREKQPKAKIVLCPIFPRGANNDDPNRARNRVVNSEIMRFADGKTVFWCDFTDQFLAKDGTLPAEIFPDRLHPAAYGYEIWAAAVLPYLDAALDGKPMPPNRFSANADLRTFYADGPVPAQPASMIGRRAWWWKDPEMWFNAVKNHRRMTSEGDGTFDIVLLGDSITRGWDGNGAAVLAELRKTYSILQLGIGGDCVQHVLWRVKNGELDGYKAKCIMLMIGTNNNYGDKAQDTALGIKRLLPAIRAKQPDATVLLMPIFPRGETPADDKRIRNETVNAQIKSLADGKHVIWLDINSKLVRPDGTISKDLMPDFLHPKVEGYRIWADAALPHFKAICGK